MRLVVIGGVAAGLSAATRARRLDASLDIQVVEKGDYIASAACGLPYLAEGRVATWRQLQVYTPEYFSRERNISVRTNAEVAAVVHPRRRVVLGGGEEIAYDRLVIATGASPIQTNRDVEDERVFHLNTMEDGIRLRDFLDHSPAGSARVSGGGYIGLEVVEVLRSRGWRVELYPGSRNLLGRDCEWLTAGIARHLERCRVTIHWDERVPTATGGGQLTIAATGLRPNVALARAAGIELGRTGAIRVTEHMETNVGGIYAAGDCVEVNHLVTNRPVWIPLGTTANKTGRVAGACAAGGRERFPGVVGTSIVRLCGLGIGLTGFSELQARREGFRPVVSRIEAADKARYFRGRPTAVELVADRGTGRLVGGVVLGDQGVEGRVNVIATAITGGLTVEEFGQLDLAYAPPFSTVWDPLLIAAQQLYKLLK
jgi:NADPH-dependent 2,4-dienoyl-CoA reductase/sulfur reductase-like enzyme